MCGFVGGYTKKGSSFSPQSVISALDLLRHRGPDSSGHSVFDLGSGTLRLGFRRLAIIDLSKSGNQPFTSEDQRFTMVFNGEIYNYLELRDVLISKGYNFRTSSDSEVLITAWAEWGLEAVNKFIGMFSIVLFDNLRSEIWCIRDAYGIKPLFFSQTIDSFFFASEISALLAIQSREPKMNHDTAMRFIIEGEYDRSVHSFFEGVSQLEPGHFFRIDLNADRVVIDSKRWWFPKIQENTSLSFEDAAQALRDQFLESVKLHLRSDVQVATALSGGLDSSAIVSVIREIAPDRDIHTFSYSADDQSIDERKWIDIVNSSTRSIPHLVSIEPTEFYSDLDDLIQTQGEPFGSTSLYAQYRVYKAAKEAGVTVMLDGQGADELLAGYFGYPENRIQSLLDKHDYIGSVALISNWSKWPGRQSKYLIRSSLRYMMPREAQIIATRYLGARRIPDFITSSYQGMNSFSNVYPEEAWNGRRLSQRLLKEQANGALVCLLRHADRNSMRWSIESRVPFLNTKLTDLVLSFPEEYLLDSKGETKSVFREAMRGIVDQRILDRKDKIGFATPQRKWITRSLINEKSILEGSESIEFLDSNRLKKYLSSQPQNSADHLNTTWRIVNLVKWKEIMGIRS